VQRKSRYERIKQIGFWTPTGRQDARRARLIYTPGASDRPPREAKPTRPKLGADKELTGKWVQTDIFSLLDSGPESG
jgi:hypothetical protein